MLTSQTSILPMKNSVQTDLSNFPRSETWLIETFYNSTRLTLYMNWNPLGRMMARVTGQVCVCEDISVEIFQFVSVMLNKVALVSMYCLFYNSTGSLKVIFLSHVELFTQTKPEPGKWNNMDNHSGLTCVFYER